MIPKTEFLTDAEKALTNERKTEITVKENRIAAYFLESGIIFHSAFIGLLLGTSKDERLVKGLAFALSFHQV